MALPQQRTVADAVVTVARCLATSEALIAAHDATGPGFISGGAAESAPPWNTAAAYAALIPWAEIRALERELRAQVTGTVAVRGGSHANTLAALDALAALAAAAPDDDVSRIMAKADRWVALTLALPAVDRQAQWAPLEPGGDGQTPGCPHGCGPTLRTHIRTQIIACIKPSCPGATGDHRPWGRPGRDSKGRLIVWSDGTPHRLDGESR